MNLRPMTKAVVNSKRNSKQQSQVIEKEEAVLAFTQVQPFYSGRVP